MSLPDIPWDFLRSASIQSLEDFELTRLNHVDLIHRRIREMLKEAVAEQSAANAARWRIEELRAALIPQPTLPFEPFREKTEAA